MRPLHLSLALTAAVAVACSPQGADDSDPFGEPESDLLARESGFGSDPDYVVRDRVVFEQESSDVVRFERQPFSHRAKRWHVFPMNVYPGARVGFRLTSEDRKMARVGEVRLYGPAFSDGSFPKAESVVLDQEGLAALPERSLEPGRYVLVVGPREKAGFAARYPGNFVTAKLDGQRETTLSLALTPEGWTASASGKSYRLVSPTPEQAANGSVALRLKAPGGSLAAETDARIVRWETRELYTHSDEAAGSSGTAGSLDAEIFSLWAAAGARRLVVHSAARIGKSEPFLLQTLPETLPRTSVIPEPLKGKTVRVAKAPDCQTSNCLVPVAGDEKAKACSPADPSVCAAGEGCFEGRCAAELPASVIGALSESYKPLFIDPAEPSTYSLEVSCRENCAPTPVERGRMTKYPVYFAHGFNSSRETWDGVRDYLRQVPGFGDRSTAASVPAFEPTDQRTDRLRQRLSTFIGFMTEAAPIAGESMRVNVIAHSMGGLDTRTLISSPRFNEQCESAVCEDVDDKTGKTSKVNCCAPAEAGRSTFWRDRIVSVTTLSTPHRGSSFASWAMSQLKDEASLGPTLKLVADRFFGLGDAGFDSFRKTIDALSMERGDEREGLLTPPNPRRVYTWACATQQERCATPAEVDGPVKAEGGRFSLPGPNDKPTVFSWAAMACTTGGCGTVLDPMLLLPYSVMAAADEKKNDGVVGVERARYGIFMGVMPADHFDWTRTREAQGSGKRALEWLFGVKGEPIERFHQAWLERLAQAGY